MTALAHVHQRLSARILTALSRGAALTLPQLATRLDAKHGSVLSALKPLLASGQVVCEGPDSGLTRPKHYRVAA